MKNLIFNIVFIFITSFCYSQVFNSVKLDTYFDGLQKNNRFMGSVAVSIDDELVYSRAVGFSDVERNIKATTKTKYRIGSISKTFTAVLFFKAVETGKIDLNETIYQYFPTFPNADKITIEDLLYHRSGIHNFTDDEDYLTWNTEPKTELEMIEIIQKGGSDFEPGTKSEYSNSNYVILSYLLEWTFKMPYSAILYEYITRPLGLNDTYFGGRINIKDNESESYRWMGKWELEAETNMIIPLGAGGVVSTPTDLVKFSDALFGNKLIDEENVNKMKTLKDDYGMGLFQFPFYDKKGFGHTGGIDGFTSIFTHLDDGNVSYALTSNGTNFDTNNISIAVLSTVYRKDYQIPDFKLFTVKPEDLDKYLGVYSSSEIPLKITVTKENAILIAQATGQPSFALEATEKDKFKYDAAGVVLEFDPSKNTMVLKQGGGEFSFKKE